MVTNDLTKIKARFTSKNKLYKNSPMLTGQFTAVAYRGGGGGGGVNSSYQLHSLVRYLLLDVSFLTLQLK